MQSSIFLHRLTFCNFTRKISQFVQPNMKKFNRFNIYLIFSKYNLGCELHATRPFTFQVFTPTGGVGKISKKDATRKMEQLIEKKTVSTVS